MPGTIYLVALFVVPLSYVVLTRQKTGQRLPPGPRKLPLVENLFDMPRGGFIWLDYAEMCRRYGELRNDSPRSRY